MSARHRPYRSSYRRTGGYRREPFMDMINLLGIFGPFIILAVIIVCHVVH
ncbi:hypothetical protein [Nocardia sp. IFM 10818]